MNEKSDLDKLVDTVIPTGPVAVYGVLAVMTSSMLSFWFITHGWGWFALIPFMLSLIQLLARVRFVPVVTFSFVLFMVSYEERNPAWFARWSDSFVQRWFLGFAIIAFLGFSYRLMALQTAIIPARASNLGLFGILGRRISTFVLRRSKPTYLKRNTASFNATELVALVVAIPLSLMLGEFVLALSVSDRTEALYYGLLPQAFSVIELIWILTMAGFVVAGLLGYLSWYRFQGLEAQTSLASEVRNWFWKEQSHMARYAAKKRNRRRWFGRKR